MSDIQEEQKRLYKKTLQNDYEELFKEKVELINLLINIDFQCYCAKLKTPTIKNIRRIIKEYEDKENERKRTK